jgi:Putative porin
MRNTALKPNWLAACALTLGAATCPLPAFAQPADAAARQSLEALQQTTKGLIEALVDKGVLTRQAADEMLQKAAANAAATATTETASSSKPVQRVPYVSEAMKAQIRSEVKEEVLTQARAERWGVPNASAAWTDRIKIDGDLNFRIQSDRLDEDNTPATSYVLAALDTDGGFIRALDYADNIEGAAQSSTTDSRTRWRVRARLGITAKLADEVSVGFRLATGNTTDRVSTNQTLGNNFNKNQFLLDRAFVRLTPTHGMETPLGVDITLGRMPNPWFSTDMIWSDNLNFEGAAVSARWSRPESGWEPFATVGAFPLRAEDPPTRSGRWLYGAQLGSAWQATARTRLKFGLAYYTFQNIEGKQETDYTLISGNVTPGSTFGQYEYDEALDQKGNTQFLVTQDYCSVASGDCDQVRYGLAYQFKPLTLTLSSEFTHFSPYSLLASAEYVHNTGVDLNDFRQRAGAAYADKNPEGDPNGYHIKLAFGSSAVRDRGDWQATLAYKHVGSDAVLDAFTDSDMGLGGTNVQGFSLGFVYGLYRNTTIGVRHLSSRTIDSPLDSTVNPDAKFGVKTLQVDLNARF